MPHNHSHCINSALAHAEKICAENNLRLTPLRKQVLELVWADHKAVKAYDIIAKMSTNTHEVKPPIVYRTLDFLLENGFIHKIHSENAFVGCPHESCSPHSSIFVVCSNCLHVDEIVSDNVEMALNQEIQTLGYSKSTPHIEVSALCKSCANT